MTQIIEYLGLIVNSLLLSLSLRQEKLVEILNLCNDLVKRKTASLREIAKILGNLGSEMHPLRIGSLQGATTFEHK